VNAAVRSNAWWLSTGQLEALKWLALAAMLVDHVNAVMFARELGTWATVAGRIAFPVFAIVLGYNLARPGVDIGRCIQRLLIVGVLAEPFHWLLFGQVGFWPLNVMLTFAVAAGVVWSLDNDQAWFAVLLFFGAGCFVEYWQPGIAVVVGTVAFFRWRYAAWSWVPLTFAFVALGWVNGNAWALLALPVVFAVLHVPVSLPRARWAFYAFYPLHLAALAVCWSGV